MSDTHPETIPDTEWDIPAGWWLGDVGWGTPWRGMVIAAAADQLVHPSNPRPELLRPMLDAFDRTETWSRWLLLAFDLAEWHDDRQWLETRIEGLNELGVPVTPFDLERLAEAATRELRYAELPATDPTVDLDTPTTSTPPRRRR